MAAIARHTNTESCPRFFRLSLIFQLVFATLQRSLSVNGNWNFTNNLVNGTRESSDSLKGSKFDSFSLKNRGFSGRKRENAQQSFRSPGKFRSLIRKAAQKLQTLSNDCKIKDKANHSFRFLSCWSRSVEKKPRVQFKQIVLSTEFEFFWAKLSRKLTENGGGDDTGEGFIYCISQFAKCSRNEWRLSPNTAVGVAEVENFANFNDPKYL